MLHDISAKYLLTYIVASIFMKWAKSLGRVSGEGGVEMRVSKRRTLHNDDEYSSLYFVQLHYNVLNDAKEKQNPQKLHLMSAGCCFRKHGENKEIYQLHAHIQSE